MSFSYISSKMLHSSPYSHKTVPIWLHHTIPFNQQPSMINIFLCSMSIMELVFSMFQSRWLLIKLQQGNFVKAVFVEKFWKCYLLSKFGVLIFIWFFFSSEISYFVNEISRNDFHRINNNKNNFFVFEHSVRSKVR